MRREAPRVHTNVELDTFEAHPFDGASYTTPHVQVSVDFDYGDHDAALAALDGAVATIREQIMRAVQDSGATMKA